MTAVLKMGVLSQPGNWSLEQIELAARERGHMVVPLEFSELAASCGSGTRSADRPIEITGQTFLTPSKEATPHFELDALDALIVRSMPGGSLEQVVTRMNLLALAEQKGLPIINSPRSLECAIDKFLTTARLAHAGLPVPATFVCETAQEALRAFEKLGRNVVLKPLFGSEGRGIFRIEEPELLWRVAQTLVRTGAVLYLQEYIDHGGRDLRVLVLNGAPLGAIERTSQEDFRTNLSLGGQSMRTELDDETASLAVAAAKTIGTVFAGVDLVRRPDGQWLLLEVNGVPGWKGFQAATGIPVATRLIEYVEQLVELSQAGRSEPGG